MAPISHQSHFPIFTAFVLACMSTIYIQLESFLQGLSNCRIFIQIGALLHELWVGWIRMTLFEFKLRSYSFCNASFVRFCVPCPYSAVPYFTIQNTFHMYHNSMLWNSYRVCSCTVDYLLVLNILVHAKSNRKGLLGVHDETRSHESLGGLAKSQYMFLAPCSFGVQNI